MVVFVVIVVIVRVIRGVFAVVVVVVGIRNTLDVLSDLHLVVGGDEEHPEADVPTSCIDAQASDLMQLLNKFMITALNGSGIRKAG